MTLAPLIRDLAVILGVAGLVSLLFQRIRQPVVLGYLIAGVIVSPHTFPIRLVQDLPNIQVWAELGVIFLMFSLGLEFSFRKLSRVGISAGITALFEVSVMLGLGFLTGWALGWPKTDCLFLAAMMGISSTTIIVRALDELQLKTRRFSQMIMGVLIVEDLLAVLILVVLSMLASTQSFGGIALLEAAGKLILVVGSWFLSGYFVLPRLVRYVGRRGSEEMLTILSLALCLMLVVGASYFNYSVALGAFIMGSILAESTESQRIEEIISPLRDLFAAIFFVSVGMLINPTVLWKNAGAVLVIVCVHIVGKITSVTLGSLVTGQTLRTSVQVGFGLANLGEFSFVIAAMGLALGVTQDTLYPIAVAVSLITTFLAPYCIRYSHKFAVRLEEKLPHRLKHVLNRYAAWSQERRAGLVERQIFYRALLRWFLNAIAVTALCFLSRELLLPWFQLLMGKAIFAVLSAWIVAIVISSPFALGMFSVFSAVRFQRVEGEGGSPRGGTLFFSRLATILWVGALSAGFLPAWIAGVFTFVIAAVFITVFYRQLALVYDWFEKTFVETFDPKQKSRRSRDMLRSLAPWDAHLVRIKVHPDSFVAGKKLIDAKFRATFGLSIVAIQRGSRAIVAPDAEQQVFPKDELLVLGTDEQVDRARVALERPPGLADRFSSSIEGYDLRLLEVKEGAPLVAKTIRESGLRERYGVLVVGIERGGRRIMNPDSDSIFHIGDSVWIVGDTKRLERMIADHA
ncbi:cation:proton antiporter [Bdellovibrionota bacterium FG-2]